MENEQDKPAEELPKYKCINGVLYEITPNTDLSPDERYALFNDIQDIAVFMLEIDMPQYLEICTKKGHPKGQLELVISSELGKLKNMTLDQFKEGEQAGETNLNIQLLELLYSCYAEDKACKEDFTLIRRGQPIASFVDEAWYINTYDGILGLLEDKEEIQNMLT